MKDLPEIQCRWAGWWNEQISPKESLLELSLLFVSSLDDADVEDQTLDSALYHLEVERIYRPLFNIDLSRCSRESVVEAYVQGSDVLKFLYRERNPLNLEVESLLLRPREVRRYSLVLSAVASEFYLVLNRLDRRPCHLSDILFMWKRQDSVQFRRLTEFLRLHSQFMGHYILSMHAWHHSLGKNFKDRVKRLVFSLGLDDERENEYEELLETLRAKTPRRMAPDAKDLVYDAADTDEFINDFVADAHQESIRIHYLL